MFSLVSGVYDAYLAPVQLNVLVVGPSSVGKTTLLERIKVTQFSKSSSKARQRGDGEAIPNVPMHWLKHSNRNDHRSAVSRKMDRRGTPQKGNNNNDRAGEGDESTNLASRLERSGPDTATNNGNDSLSRSWLGCPAPNRYSKAGLQDDDEEEASVRTAESDAAAQLGPIPSPIPMRKVRKATTSSSLESVDLMDNATKAVTKVATCCVDSSPAQLVGEASEEPNNSIPAATNAPAPPLNAADATSSSSHVPAELLAAEEEVRQAEEEEQLQRHEQQQFLIQQAQNANKEFDLKHKCKMLPLDKIRRTIGMNLGKINIHGAHCHFWDLGGRMHELWERYYFDSDAVIFVWKTPVEANEEDARKETELQQSLLEEVRSSIPDDVPFLVLGHIFAEKRNPTGVGSAPPSGNTTESNLTMPASNISPLSAASSPKTDVMYSTARLLPHYHNPLQALFFVNAANGQGVKSAIDWLVPMAKRQLKVRESRPVEEIDDVNKK